MSARPDFTFPFPLRRSDDAPGSTAPRLWYTPVAGAGRIHLAVVRGIPTVHGDPRWVCYGPAGLRVTRGQSFTCLPREARPHCLLMLREYIEADAFEWMPQGHSSIERELLSHSPFGW